MNNLPSTPNEEFFIVDEETYKWLKDSLEKAEKTLFNIREAKKQVRQYENVINSDNPSSGWSTLLDQEREAIRHVEEIQDKLARCQIKEHNDFNNSIIEINDYVTLKLNYSDEDEEKTNTYKLVSVRTDPFSNEISKNSPIGAGILGKKINQTITVPLKNGTILQITILAKN